MFIARSLSVTEDEAGWVLALTDDRDNPIHYLLIQRSRLFDEQEPGAMGNLYYEIDDQSQGFYDGVNGIRLSRSTLSLAIDPTVAGNQSLPFEVEIGLELTLLEWEDLRIALRRITEFFVLLEVTP